MKALRFVAVSVGTIALVACSGHPPVYLATPGEGAAGLVEDSLTPGTMRLKPSVCDGESLKPEYGRLDETALITFLSKHGFESKTERARSDLVFVDVSNAADHIVRLRVAILPDTAAAGLELNHAILQHGPGSWGVHRGNLAVLAPIGDAAQIVAFANKTKLACWGVLTIAGRDDTFVTTGGYYEL